MIEAVARHLGDGELATQRAIGLFTLLVASLQLARAITDPALSAPRSGARSAQLVRACGEPRSSC